MLSGDVSVEARTSKLKVDAVLDGVILVGYFASTVSLNVTSPGCTHLVTQPVAT